MIAFIGAIIGVTAPFLNLHILDRSPTDERSAVWTVTGIWMLVPLLILVALFFHAETLFGDEHFYTTLTILLIVGSIALLIRLVEGLMIRSIIIDEERAGFASFLPRGATILVMAFLTATLFATTVAGPDLLRADRQDFEQATVVERAEADQQYDAIIDGYEAAVEQANARLFDYSDFEIPDVGPLNARLQTLQAQLLSRGEGLRAHQARVRDQEAKVQCELRGLGCFGSTINPGPGPRYNAAVIELETLEQGVREMEAGIAQLQRQYDAVLAERDRLLPDPEDLFERQVVVDGLRAELIEARSALAAAEQGRDAFVEAAVPYVEPGPLTRYQLLWDELVANPAALVVFGLAAVFLSGLEAAALLSAVSLRGTSYAVALRANRRRATVDAELVHEEAVADAVENREAAKQRALDSILYTLEKERAIRDLDRELGPRPEFNDDFPQAAE